MNHYIKSRLRSYIKAKLSSVNPTNWFKELVRASTWFIGFLPIGAILFLLVPFLLYKIYSLEIKQAPDAPTWGSEQLKTMGKISKKEITLCGLVVLALALWIKGTDFIDATATIAVLAVSLTVVFRVVSWDDIIGYKQAWNVLVWFATPVTMADGLAIARETEKAASTPQIHEGKIPKKVRQRHYDKREAEHSRNRCRLHPRQGSKKHRG